MLSDRQRTMLYGGLHLVCMAAGIIVALVAAGAAAGITYVAEWVGSFSHPAEEWARRHQRLYYDLPEPDRVPQLKIVRRGKK